MVILDNGYIPSTLDEALQIRSENKVIPYAGGTDLMIIAEDVPYLFLNKLAELQQISVDGDMIRIGAGCTYTSLLDSPITPKVLKEAIRLIAAPAIRNLGTVGGNICNASPKADSALIFYVSDSKLRLRSVKGERILPIEDFYVGRGKTVLQPDELLIEILMPKKYLDNYYYQKVGARQALAISRVAFVGLFGMEDGKITCCSTAYGSVSDTILRFRNLEAMLLGKTIAEAKELKGSFLAEYDKAIVPIRGRVSADYRKRVCMNLLEDYLTQNGI
ncbi:MAG TPA: FAD binding domain-containing protein [Flexilinea sp.]|nr:FAD binding domain-containing protein [Flexilinea sp.]